MIEAKNLKKWYGTNCAVNDVSFDVKKGEVLGFLGPNGAGKSTTMRMITGFLHLDGGSVRIGEHSIEDEPVAAKAMMGYLPENAPLYGDVSVEGFLGYIAKLRGLRGQDHKGAVAEAIETCSLESVRHKTIQTLSKGYRHRTCFAQSILHDPDVLIMDEPTDGLDPNQKYEMRNLIKRMGERKAIIISTHILEEVDAICNRIIIIDQGRIREDSTPDALRKSRGGTLEQIFRRLTTGRNSTLVAGGAA
ncbi:MAG: ATP-binding cassette domain-containing protein [Lentisphaeria bacterium]|nr:ATP-binding cassette domain-containing protein [Lentisphaeria bacterium]